MNESLATRSVAAGQCMRGPITGATFSRRGGDETSRAIRGRLDHRHLEERLPPLERSLETRSSPPRSTAGPIHDRRRGAVHRARQRPPESPPTTRASSLGASPAGPSGGSWWTSAVGSTATSSVRPRPCSCASSPAGVNGHPVGTAGSGSLRLRAYRAGRQAAQRSKGHGSSRAPRPTIRAASERDSVLGGRPR